MSKAKHIDPERTKDNFYWTWDGQGRKGGQLFEDSEKRYYGRAFAEALTAQNERHIRSRHEERIKTMDDWLTGKNTRPEESIYQIGDMNAKIDPHSFRKAAGELLNWLNDWSARHGRPYRVLNAAGHMDETSYHMQVRRVWQYRDADGNWCIGQNKALEAAGIPLPDPSAKIGPKNNRKITFDRMVREKWIEICEKYGYEIERTPNEKHTEHMSKEALAWLNEARKELADAKREAEAERDRFHGMAEASKGVASASRSLTAKQRAARGLPTLPGE